MGTQSSVIEGKTWQLHRQRPTWLKGSINQFDMECLYSAALLSPNDVFTEVGIASGLSSAVILTAIDELRGNQAHANPKLYSYDLLPHCYWDKSIPVGQAARDLVPEKMPYMTIRTRMTALDFVHFHEKDSVGFCFIDANHKHPWPSLDLLSVLPFMDPHGIICLHDINLPLIQEDFPVYGVKNIFDSVDCEKSHSNEEIPNTGVLRLRDDRQKIAEHLTNLVKSIDWEIEVPREHLVKLHFDVDGLASSNTSIKIQ